MYFLYVRYILNIWLFQSYSGVSRRPGKRYQSVVCLYNTQWQVTQVFIFAELHNPFSKMMNAFLSEVVLQGDYKSLFRPLPQIICLGLCFK